MFIPLHDRNALKHIRRQYVTLGLILANVVTHALATLAPEALYEIGGYGMGFIPAVAFDIAELDPRLVLGSPTYSYRPKVTVDNRQSSAAIVAANPGVGAIGWKGGMLDRPYLARAERLLRQAGKL